MKIDKIEGFSLTDNEYEMDHLTGLRMHLSGATEPSNIIGTKVESGNKTKVVKFDASNAAGHGNEGQPQSIKILYDEHGVCNVLLKKADGSRVSLSQDNLDCQPEYD